MSITVILVLLIAGLIAGGVAGWFISKSKFDKPLPFTFEEYLTLKNGKSISDQRLEDGRKELDVVKQELAFNRGQVTEHRIEITSLSATNRALEEKMALYKEEMENLHKKIKEQFENIASKIVFDNSRLIQQQHTDKLTDILNPLKEKIEKFESTVNTTHKENIRENQSLKEQLRMLQDLNKSIGEEARNLTTALKGQVKTQGNWGELILETILERSGLVKDREYFLQNSMTSEEGRRQQPDVLIKLPDNRTIIIDSKVSLVAYERYCSATTEPEKEAALKEHITSLRRHVKGLSEKKYQELSSLKTLDFILLFVPIEPAFNTAISNDNNIFSDAFDDNIVMVSTSTLLATLRTIASIWKLEYTNTNAREIARQGGALYDKFVGFVSDLEKVGDQINRSQRVWEDAKNKLSTGSGNLVRSAQKLQKLVGGKHPKKLPAAFLTDSLEEEDPDNAEQVTDKL